jgi:hypothetical protein
MKQSLGVRQNVQILKHEGYTVVRKALTTEHMVTLAKPNVDYETFIETEYLPALNKALGWNAVYALYQFNTNNNESNTPTYYNCTEDETVMPIYTSILFLEDDSTYEVVPESHLKERKDSLSFFKKEKLEMGAGDLLVMHADLLHQNPCSPTSFHMKKRTLRLYHVFPDLKSMEKVQKRMLNVVTGYNPLELTRHVSSTVSYWAVQQKLQYAWGDVSTKEKKNNFVCYFPHYDFSSLKKENGTVMVRPAVGKLVQVDHTPHMVVGGLVLILGVANLAQLGRNKLF